MPLSNREVTNSIVKNDVISSFQMIQQAVIMISLKMQ